MSDTQTPIQKLEGMNIINKKFNLKYLGIGIVFMIIMILAILYTKEWPFVMRGIVWTFFIIALGIAIMSYFNKQWGCALVLLGISFLFGLLISKWPTILQSIIWFIFISMSGYILLYMGNASNDNIKKHIQVFTKLLLIISGLFAFIHFAFFTQYKWIQNSIHKCFFLLVVGIIMLFLYLNRVQFKDKKQTEYKSGSYFASFIIEIPRIILMFFYKLKCILLDSNQRNKWIESSTTYFAKNKKWFMITILSIVILHILLGIDFMNRKMQNMIAFRILNEKTFIHKEKTIPTSSLFGDDTEFDNERTIMNRNRAHSFSIGFWIFIAQPSVFSDSDETIINFADAPHITYNTRRNTLKVSMKVFHRDAESVLNNIGKTPDIESHTEVIYENTLELQKWNYIVFNYDHGVMDVFINGSLVKSEKKYVAALDMKGITIGNDNKLEGGIKQVTFSHKPMNMLDIQLLYYLEKMINIKLHL